MLNDRGKLDALKADSKLLCDVLGIRAPGYHNPCRFCESSDALSVYKTASGGWRFKCHACDSAGDAFDALAMAEGIAIGAAIERLTGTSYTPPPSRPTAPPQQTEPIEPKPHPSSRAFIDICKKRIANTETQKAALQKRGLSSGVQAKYGFCFFDQLTLKQNSKAQFHANFWAIPISGASGNPVAVKIHREEPIAEREPKSFWLPIGTEPTPDPAKGIRARHGFATLYPSFDAVPAAERIFICPGELKAFAVLSASRNATSITAGESHRWTPKQIERFKGRRVCVLYDDDESGHRFRDKTLLALHGVASELKAITLGKKQNGSKLDANDYARENGIESLANKLDNLCSETENFKPEAQQSPVHNNGSKPATGEPRAKYNPPSHAKFALANGHAQESDTMEPIALPPDQWPAPPGEDAFLGLAGEVARTIEQYSEADPVALLVQFLVAVGSIIGRNAYWTVGGTRHYANMFAVIIGKSAKGRKGTSWDEIGTLFEQTDWFADRVKGGLSSAEGLISQVRDEIKRTNPLTGDFEIVAEGVKDKRLFLLESEFCKVLKQSERPGNTLSALIRQAWDKGTLESLVKNSPEKATGAHVSIMGHITHQELLRNLTSTETGNGFANRFLWVCVRRSKLLPDGASVPQTIIESLRGRLKQAVDFAAASSFVMARDNAATDFWREVYGELTAEHEGLAAAVCGRAEAQTMRLAMIYALLDQSNCIRIEHLKAGYALWKYCENSASCIFGDALGDPTADEIWGALRNNSYGLTQSDVGDLFKRNKPAGEINRALGVLLSAARVVCIPERTSGGPGRTAKRWFAVQYAPKQPTQAISPPEPVPVPQTVPDEEPF